MTNKVTIKDIAVNLGVSHTTVSAALSNGRSPIVISEATRKRVIQAAKKLNYQPNHAARQLAGKSSGIIAVLLTDLNLPGHADILRDIQEHASRKDFLLSIGHTQSKMCLLKKNLEVFAGHRTEGLLCLGPLVSDWDQISAEMFGNFERTIFYPKPIIPNAAYVDVDRVQAARLATEHLIKTGRKRIALALSSINQPSDMPRRQGFEQELSLHGIASQESLIFYGDCSFIPSPEVVSRAIDKLVIEQKADAIIANQDYFGMQLISQLKRRGIQVPGDVAIIGIGNHLCGQMLETPLTTIDLQMQLIAIPMCQMLEKMMQENRPLKPEERVVVIPPRLIIREST